MRKLDFIVAGPGRSGTSAVARSLSAARGVHCSIELYWHSTDHSQLSPPTCFRELSSPDLPRGMRRPKAGLLRFTLSELDRHGEDLRWFGNKTPNYSYRLAGLLDEIAPGRGILCWRDLRGIARSYARRADNPEDDWDAGRRGIFAVHDVAVSLGALAGLDRHDVMIVPNRALLSDWHATTAAMLDYVAPGLGTPEFHARNLAEIEARRPKTGEVSADPEFSEAEERALARLAGTGVDTVLNLDRPFMLSDVRTEVRRCATELPTRPLDLIRPFVAEDGRQITTDFFRKIEKQAKLANAARNRPIPLGSDRR